LESLEKGELKNLLVQPAKLNPFAYALNNPVRYNDPDGRDPRPRPTERKPQAPEPELTFRIGGAAEGTKELSALSFSIAPQRGMGSASFGSGGGGGSGKAGPPSITIYRHSDSATPELFKKSNEGLHIKSLVLIVPGKERDYRIVMKDVIIESMSATLNGVEERPGETFTLNAGTVEFEGPPSPSPAPHRESLRSWALEPRNGQ